LRNGAVWQPAVSAVRAFFKNNIICNPRDLFVEIQGLNNVRMDYNLYYCTLEILLSLGCHMDLSSRAADNGCRFTFDPNKSCVCFQQSLDPSDFKLNIESKAINSGVNVGLTSDFDGAPVPNRFIPDIGAFEFNLRKAQFQAGKCIIKNESLRKAGFKNTFFLNLLK